MKRLPLIATTLLMCMMTSVAFAAEEGAAKLDTGDTAWVLISAALVFIMTPGLGFFYGGMVRSKNVLSTIMQSFFIVGLISVEWVLFGYTLTFGSDVSGIIGSLEKVGLMGITVDTLSGTIPEFAFIAFQCMFAVITPALITGAFAERVRFSAFAVFIFLWAVFIYNPMAHWVWGGGWLAELGALDFAGGLVIHILSGVSGLVFCLMIGKRRGYGKTAIVPHNVPMIVLGASLLWIGWFGFNAGSALGANGLAANAFVTTQVAAAAGVVSWVISEWSYSGRPTVFGAASGCVAGLVAITPAAGFVTPLPAVIIGLVGGVVCYFSVAVMKAKFGYDDSLDAFGVHGIGGTWGAIATGLWATTSVNPDGANGLFYGNSELLVIQLISVVAAYALAIVGTVILVKIVGSFMKIRVDANDEIAGVDLSEHGECAYNHALAGGTSVFGAPSGETALFAQMITSDENR
jgi:Amt family ammonium transporter